MSIYRDKARGRYRFEFDAYVNGARIRTTKLLPKTWNRAQADAFDRQKGGQLHATIHGIGGADPLIDDAVSLYLDHRAPALKGEKNVGLELGYIAHFYAGRPLSALPDVCKDIQLRSVRELAKDQRPLAPATIKNRISYLRAACRYAWKEHYKRGPDPAASVTVPQVRNERHTYITRRQMLKLARACAHRPTRAAIRIAFYSGMRLGEIERRETHDGCFLLRDSKNGDPRLVPIHPRINTCLQYKLGTRFQTHYHFTKARALVGMTWLHFHDLRHAAASELINQGVDLYTVGAVLGHRSAASTKRYAHLATDKLAIAIRKMGKRA